MPSPNRRGPVMTPANAGKKHLDRLDVMPIDLFFVDRQPPRSPGSLVSHHANPAEASLVVGRSGNRRLVFLWVAIGTLSCAMIWVESIRYSSSARSRSHPEACKRDNACGPGSPVKREKFSFPVPDQFIVSWHITETGWKRRLAIVPRCARTGWPGSACTCSVTQSFGHNSKVASRTK